MPNTTMDRASPSAGAVFRSPALWLGVGIGAVGLADTGRFDPSGLTTFMLPLLALSYLVFAAFRHGPRRSVALRIQTAGLLGFTALALIALVADPALGRYLVAAGWLAHAGWDFAHRDGRVVPKWYVQFCIPLDVLMAVSLVIGA
ncbi:MAG TPA: hypothetical protein VHO00_11415 [Actinomycetes bacterium]|nr:hypothetical protein [Actinomycetes bacterium]